MSSKAVENKIQEALPEVVKKVPNSTVVRKYDVPNHTLSTRINSKDKIMQFWREWDNIKRQRIRYTPNENLDRAV